jgi:hypothetical protein
MRRNGSGFGAPTEVCYFHRFKPVATCFFEHFNEVYLYQAPYNHVAVFTFENNLFLSGKCEKNICYYSGEYQQFAR